MDFQKGWATATAPGLPHAADDAVSGGMLHLQSTSMDAAYLGRDSLTSNNA
jgi:hypothetical protein